MLTLYHYIPEDVVSWGIDPPEASQVPAIQMDDLLEVIHFKKAVMKIAVEGDEHKAMSACSKLLGEVDIPYILMEWTNLKDKECPRETIITVQLRSSTNHSDLMEVI